MMKILIIGGNRFFGKTLSRKLCQHGHEVTILNRGNLDNPYVSQKIIMDRLEFSADHPMLKGKTWDLIYDQVCYDSNEALASCETFSDKSDRYVFISTQSVYQQKANLKEEDFDPYLYTFSHATTRATNYGEAKRQAEATFFAKGKFPITAVRFPIVLGLDDYTERLKFYIRKIKLNQPVFLPNMNAKMSIINSEDAADFLVHLSHQSKVMGPINCASSIPMSIKQFIQLIEKVVGAKGILTTNPSESPYGITSDAYMNVDKMNTLGFRTYDWVKWLPSLISQSVD